MVRLRPLKGVAAGVLVCAAAAACGCARYHPAPLDPPRLESDYRSRSLVSPELRAFIEKAAGRAVDWPPRKLDLETLSLAARFYNPDLESARARLRVAEAEVVTAGGRPNPSVAAGAGYANSADSHFIFHLDPALVIETAGKRRLRILLAEKNAEAARLSLAETEWRVRSRVRAAVVEYLFAAGQVELLEREEKARADAAALLERRLAAGEASRPEVDSARLAWSNAAVVRQGADGRAGESRSALAAEVGVPVAALDGLPLDWSAANEIPPAASLPLEQVQRAGLLHRLDVQRSLLEYAVAEAALKLAVARQYPDIEISPGYSFDEAHHKFMFGPALALPLFNRNRGPIAEAEARRKEAEAQFIAAQAAAIADLERALTRYRAALSELAEASDRLTAAQDQRERAVRRAVEVGEDDSLALAGARVESAVAARVRLEAWRKAQGALGALEDAVQRPLTSGAAVFSTQERSGSGSL